MKEFTEWLDEHLPTALPPEVKGLSFNLNENADSFSIELVGTEEFNEEDPDWACEEIWEPAKRKIELSISGDWSDCLEKMKSVALDYLINGRKKEIFDTVEGVGIGFVDGDLEIIKKSYQ